MKGFHLEGRWGPPFAYAEACGWHAPESLLVEIPPCRVASVIALLDLHEIVAPRFHLSFAVSSPGTNEVRKTSWDLSNSRLLRQREKDAAKDACPLFPYQLSSIPRGFGLRDE